MTLPESSATRAPALAFSLRATLGWLFRLLVRPLRKGGRHSSRYLLLSPPFIRRQLIHDSSDGSTFIVNVRSESDLGIVGQIFGAEEYRLERLARCDELLGEYESICAAGESPLILDCGANIGLASVYFARLFPKAHIIAIEPEPGNIALARSNCLHYPNVEFIQAGVANARSTGTIVDPRLGDNAYRTTLDTAGKTKLVAINALLADAGNAGRRPFIVKIDIEGFEENLFADHVEWVDEFPLLVIELHDWLFRGSANSRNFLRCVSGLERDFVYMGENIFSLRNGSRGAN